MSPFSGRVATPPHRVDVLGVPVDALAIADVVAEVERLLERGGGAIIAPVNADIVNRAVDDAELRSFLQSADLVHADGQGVVLGARVLGDPLPERVTSIKLIWALCKRWSQGEHSFYFLGGPPGVAEQAAQMIHAQYPGVRIVGTHRGHLSADDEREVLADIARTKPDVLCVGFGTPNQERFIERNRDQLEDVPLTWPVGALTTHVAGLMPRAPRFMRKNGMEWLWRFMLEPRRLWRRYLVGNTVFAWRVVSARAQSDLGGVLGRLLGGRKDS